MWLTDDSTPDRRLQPTYTSPHMYRKIDSLARVPTRYQQELLESGVIEKKEVERLEATTDQEYEKALKNWESYNLTTSGQNGGLIDLQSFPGNLLPGITNRNPGTGVEAERLRRVGRASVTTPEDFVSSHIYPSISKVVQLPYFE